MPKHDNRNDQLAFKNLRDESDYPLLLELNQSSREADHDHETITLDMIAQALSNMDGMTQQQGVIIASLGDKPVGYSRLGWYSSRPNTRLYYQISFLLPEYRTRGFWPQMIADNEHRLRQVTTKHAGVPECYFQAWASDRQNDWSAVLNVTGYHVVRRFNNMLSHWTNYPTTPFRPGWKCAR